MTINWDHPLVKSLIGGGSVALIWEALPRLLSIPASILPPFSLVVKTAILRHKLIVPHAVETAEEVVVAFVLTLTIAGLLALAMDYWPWLGRILNYPLVAFQNVPKVALAPLLVLWFSYGMAPKVVMGVLIAFYPIFEGFREGLNTDRTGARKTFAVLGPSKWNILFRVKLPESLPHVFQGMRVGITFATIGAIVGEMAQPSSGLGYLIEEGKENFQTDLQFAAVLVVSLLGLALFGLIVLLEDSRFLRKYKNTVVSNASS